MQKVESIGPGRHSSQGAKKNGAPKGPAPVRDCFSVPTSDAAANGGSQTTEHDEQSAGQTDQGQRAGSRRHDHFLNLYDLDAIRNNDSLDDYIILEADQRELTLRHVDPDVLAGRDV